MESNLKIVIEDNEYEINDEKLSRKIIHLLLLAMASGKTDKIFFHQKSGIDEKERKIKNVMVFFDILMTNCSTECLCSVDYDYREGLYYLVIRHGFNIPRDVYEECHNHKTFEDLLRSAGA